MAEVVVITGAIAGVGRATVRAFAGRGASIALLARDEEGLLEAAREAEAAGARALPLVTDVSDPDAVERAAAQAGTDTQARGSHARTHRHLGKCRHDHDLFRAA